MKINKAGHLYIGTTILIALAGVNTGNNLIYLTASFLLAYMLISGWMAQLNLKGITVQMHYPDEIFAGVSFPVFIRLRNTKKHTPSFFLNVEAGNDRRFILWLPPDAEINLTLYSTCHRRGINEISAPRIYSSFPFNFFTRMRPVGESIRILVFPKPEECSPSEISRFDESGVSDRKRDRAYDFDNLISIRNYHPGDPWKFINWKATAKTGELKVNELDAEKPDYVILDLVNIPKEYCEDILGCYTYLALELSKSSVPVGVKTRNAFISPGVGKDHLKKILTILALYDESQTDP